MEVSKIWANQDKKATSFLIMVFTTFWAYPVQKMKTLISSKYFLKIKKYGRGINGIFKKMTTTGKAVAIYRLYKMKHQWCEPSAGI